MKNLIRSMIIILLLAISSVANAEIVVEDDTAIEVDDLYINNDFQDIIINEEISLSSDIYQGSVIENKKRIAINKKNFPDKVFREYVYDNFDWNGDEYLSENEIKKVTKIDVTEGGGRYDAYDEPYYIKSLKGIEYFTNLQELECLRNKLTKLDVSKNTKLVYLNCWGNKLKHINISRNPELSRFYCGDNLITKLDVSNNTKLVELGCSENKLTKLNVRNNQNLKRLSCGNNKIIDLKMTGLRKLEYLSCEKNNLKSLDIKGCIKLLDKHYYTKYYILDFDYGKTKLLNGRTILFDVLPQYKLGSYDSLARKPKVYRGKKIYFDGKILQVIENGKSITFRIATDEDGDDVFWCTYQKPKNYSRFIEDDVVRIYGVSTGLHTYTSVWNEKITIPSCSVDKIEFHYFPYNEDDEDDEDDDY